MLIPKMPLPTPATVFHLEMRRREAFRPSAARPGFDVVAVDPPDPGLNRRFYASVGAQWQRRDRLAWTADDWESYVGRDAVRTYLGRLDGAEAGYFELEAQEGGNVEIVYLGLLPAFIGRGLGGNLLSAAVEFAWGFPGATRVWVHTCTLDHKHALENYLARGFEIFRADPPPPTGI